jgi:alpha-L-fucosidase
MADLHPNIYEPSWESLKKWITPQWYLDGKFGIFIHWGLYCVPAFANEWYPRNMYLQGSPEYEFHRSTFGPQNRFGYKDFIPMFQAEQYDPRTWADLFRRAGAKFVVPVAEHHDGFAMYDTRLSRWSAAKMGPKRDLIGELAEAVREQGLVFGVSSHRAEHWFFMNGGRDFDSDVNDPAFADFYGPAVPTEYSQLHAPGLWNSRDWTPRPDARFLDDWLARCCELVDLYQPQLFWFDWWIEQIVFQPYVQKFAAYYYNRSLEWQKGVAINYKNQTFAEGSAVLDIERGQLKEIRPFFWQNDTSVSKNSWGYVQNHDYKTATSIICDLVDIISKNGALLLNIGPRPDGTIPDQEQEILLEIGQWLNINGEAIYGTRPWLVYGEGPTEVLEGAFTDTKRHPYTGQDIRFTESGTALYATLLAWPGPEVSILSLGKSSPFRVGKISHIALLGGPDELAWSQNVLELKIQLPEQQIGKHAFVIKIIRDL